MMEAMLSEIELLANSLYEIDNLNGHLHNDKAQWHMAKV